MKLLFDENLSPDLAIRLADIFPGSAHVHALGLGAAADEAIWSLAAREGWLIATKDADFVRLSALLGAPPKLVLLRAGNCSVDEMESIFRRHAEKIAGMEKSTTMTFVVVGRT